MASSNEITANNEWTESLFEKLALRSKSFLSEWCGTAFQIDSEEEYLESCSDTLLENLNCVFENLLQEVHSEYDNIIDNVSLLCQEIQTFEKKLGIKQSFLSNQWVTRLSLKQTQNQLQLKIEEYEKALREKEDKYTMVNKKYDILREKLSVAPTRLSWDHSITAIKNFEQELIILEEAYETKKKRLSTLRQMYEETIASSGLIPEVSFPQSSENSPIVSDEILEEAEHCFRSITKQKYDLVEEIEDLKTKIEELWEEMNIPANTRNEFLKNIENYSVRSLQYLQGELGILENLKEENLGIIIEQLREKLSKLWDQCHCGITVKQDFPISYVQEKKKEHVDVYKKEISKWTSFYFKHNKILNTIEEYQRLHNSRKEFELNKNPKEFYKNRGGKALEQLKKMKIIDTKLQKTEKCLLELSENFRQVERKNFTTFDDTVEIFITKLKENMLSKKVVIYKPSSPALLQVPSTSTNKTTPKATIRNAPTKYSSNQKKIALKNPPQKLQKKKGTPSVKVPIFKLNQSVTKANSSKRWNPTQVHNNNNKEKDEEDWTSITSQEYGEFESAVKTTPRSSSVGGNTN